VPFFSNLGPTYDNYANCSWPITAAPGNIIWIVFSSFVTEARFDFVYVYDGLNTSSPILFGGSGGVTPLPDRYTTDNAALVTFTSDYSVVASGFTAIAYATGPSCNGSQPITATSRGSPFRSNAANQYKDFANCAWPISSPTGTVIRIVFSSLETEPCCDTVTVYDGPSTSSKVLWSGRGSVAAGFELYATGNAVLVTFTSDGSVVAAGFTAMAYAIDSCCSGSQSLTATSQGVTFQSNRALKYINFANCSWAISAPAGKLIWIVFYSFETEASFDFVKVYDGPSALPNNMIWSGDGPRTSNLEVYTTGSAALVTFTSDGSIVYEGFTAIAYTTDLCCNGSQPIRATYQGMTFRSNIASQYNNSRYCSWPITAPTGLIVRIVFSSFETEDCCDTVTVHDGPTESFPTLWSRRGIVAAGSGVLASGNTALVTFFSDPSVVFSGFTATAYALDPSCFGSQPLLATSQGAPFTSNWAPTYNVMANCSWPITAPSRKRIRILFSSFATELNYDFVKVYDGLGANAAVIWSGNGTIATAFEVYTTGSAALVTFTSDGSVNLAGFRAMAYAVDLVRIIRNSEHLPRVQAALTKDNGAIVDETKLLDETKLSTANFKKETSSESSFGVLVPIAVTVSGFVVVVALVFGAVAMMRKIRRTNPSAVEVQQITVLPNMVVVQ